MPGILGTIAAGAATGAANADIKNTATQNQVAAAENIGAYQAAVNNMYQERMAEYQMGLRMRYIGGMHQAMTQETNKELAGMGLVAPGETPGPGQKVATPEQFSQVQGNAALRSGYVSGDEAFKGAASIMGEKERAEGYKEAFFNKGVGAAMVNAPIKQQQAETARLLALAKTGGAISTADAVKILVDPIASRNADLVAKANATLGIGQPHPPGGVLSTNQEGVPQAPAAPTTYSW